MILNLYILKKKNHSNLLHFGLNNNNNLPDQLKNFLKNLFFTLKSIFFFKISTESKIRHDTFVANFF